MLGAGCKSSNRSGEGAVHARAAGDSFEVTMLFEDLLDQESGKPNFADLNQKTVWPGYDVGCGLDIDMIPLEI
jgi:hypothetical protein